MDWSLRRLGRRGLLLAGTCAAGIALAVSHPAAADNSGFGNQQWYQQGKPNHGSNGRGNGNGQQAYNGQYQQRGNTMPWLNGNGGNRQQGNNGRNGQQWQGNNGNNGRGNGQQWWQNNNGRN